MNTYARKGTAVITGGSRARSNLKLFRTKEVLADGSLSAAVEHVYPLNQFKEAQQSLKSNCSGKILFEFGVTDVAGISK